MTITENAITKLRTFVRPDAGLAEGIRIAQGSGCCGPSFKMSVVKQPHPEDIRETHDGINIYLDRQFAGITNDIIIDFCNDYFQIRGANNSCNSGCC